MFIEFTQGSGRVIVLQHYADPTHMYLFLSRIRKNRFKVYIKIHRRETSVARVLEFIESIIYGSKTGDPYPSMKDIDLIVDLIIPGHLAS